MKTLASLTAILLVAAPLTGCVGAEPLTDDMSYEDPEELAEPKLQEATGEHGTQTDSLKAQVKNAAGLVPWTWRNVYSGKCLGIYGGNMTNGTKAIQWTCGAADAYWLPVGIDDGYYYRFRNNVNPNKCLAVPGSATAWGVQLVIWDCADTDDQFWKVTSVSNGYQIENYHSGLVIAVASSGTHNGAQLVQWPWAGIDDQKWQ